MIELKLEKNSGIPIYLQIKEQIRKLISEGELKSGDRLPPERELAQAINVSRNTVSIAYKELVAEEVLVSLRGKGTFVADSVVSPQRDSMREKLTKIIDNAMEEATSLGFSIDEFVDFTHIRAMAKKELLSKLRIAFIDCHKEQLEYFEKKIHLGPGVKVIPILLEELVKGNKDFIENLEKFDMIITSLKHLKEVNKLLPNAANKILEIALQPQVELIVRLAKLPTKEKVGIVCHTEGYSKKVQQALENVGVNHLDWHVFTSELDDNSYQKLKQFPLIITCASRKAEIEQIINNEVEIIEFSFLPDAGSLNMIRSALLECKRQE